MRCFRSARLLQRGAVLAVALTALVAPRLAAADPLDLPYIPASAVAAAVLHPAELLAREELKLLPIEVMQVAGKKELGIDPLNVEQVVALLGPIAPPNPPAFGVILRLKTPHELDALLPVLRDQTETAEREDASGKKIAYRKGRSPAAPSYALLDGTTLLIGSEAFLGEMLAAAGGSDASPLRQRLAEADVSADVNLVVAVEPLRELLKQGLVLLGDPPPPLAGLKDAPDQIDFAEFRLSLKDAFRAELSLRARDEAAAEALEASLGQALEFARQQLLAEMKSGGASTDPVEKAAQAYAQRLTNIWLEELRPRREGDVLTVDVESKLSGATLGVAAALLLPAVQATRDATSRVATQNNLHQILIAMHNHEIAEGKLPPQAITDAEGKPLLSWRVKLLPYLEGGGLYDQFRLDEPWDSEHNLKLVQRIPDAYQNPGLPRDGKTNYLAPVAKGTVFGEAQGLGFNQLHDGSSNTIVLLEADPDKAVPWTKPEDLAVDPDNAKSGLGQAQPRGGILAGFADGSVQTLKPDVSPQTLWKLFTFAGAEAVNFDEY